jgi:hypothetical protein
MGVFMHRDGKKNHRKVYNRFLDTAEHGLPFLFNEAILTGIPHQDKE